MEGGIRKYYLKMFMTLCILFIFQVLKRKVNIDANIWIGKRVWHLHDNNDKFDKFVERGKNETCKRQENLHKSVVLAIHIVVSKVWWKNFKALGF